MDSSSLSHTRYKCQYHIVFIPKYRKRIMYGRLKADVREIIKKLCDYRNIEIVEGAVCADHVHLCLSIPPSEKVSDVVGYIKGKSALMIHDKYPESVNGWSKAFWARGYYVATVGNITEDAVKKYIQQQKEESKREDTRWSYVKKKYKLRMTFSILPAPYLASFCSNCNIFFQYCFS